MPVHVVPPTRNPHGRETISPGRFAVNGLHQWLGKTWQCADIFSRTWRSRGLVAPCGRGRRVVISGRPYARSRPNMPLQLNDDEMNVLLSLAGPIDQQRRPQFLQEVAQELEASGQTRRPGRRAPRRPRGSAQIFRSAAAAQRGQDGARLKGQILKLENYGRGRDYRSSSVLAFSRNRPALVSYHPTKDSMRVAGMEAHNRPGHLNCSSAPTRARSWPSPGRILVRKRQRPGSEHYGRDRDYRSSSVLAFSANKSQRGKQ
jgi:hypothetical protein